MPAMVAMVAVAEAVHYQGSQRMMMMMVQTTIAGPNPIAGQTSPWTRTWRVWRAPKVTRSLNPPGTRSIFVPHDG